jgi:hypothetical protein
MAKLPIFGAFALAFATPAAAQNALPPAHPVFFLTGQLITLAYQNFSFTFTAAQASTSLTFAMRHDSSYIFLDNISMVTSGASTNLLVNGGFEDGVVGSAAPVGWTYANPQGAANGGTVYPSSGAAYAGNNAYVDGAVQAYDELTQVVATTIGLQYTVDFYERAGGTGLYQPLSTAGNVPGINGNGIDLFVYAQAGLPAPGGVPEPSSWVLMLAGFGGVGIALRSRRRIAGGGSGAPLAAQ